MSFIVKCPPVTIGLDGRCLVFAKRYEGVAPVAGQPVFLWFSETKGGRGLAHRGWLSAVGDGDPMALAIEVDSSVVTSPIGKADLAPHRDVTEPTPLSGLASKLYKHSLDKVAGLSAEEAAYLSERFGEAAPASDTDKITEAALTAREHVRGDGRRMYADTARYRLTTTLENPDAENQRKPGTLRGIAADFIRRNGGVVTGRQLHHFMLSNSGDRKWDYGYVHLRSGAGKPKRGASRDWLRPAD